MHVFNTSNKQINYLYETSPSSRSVQVYYKKNPPQYSILDHFITSTMGEYHVTRTWLSIIILCFHSLHQTVQHEKLKTVHGNMYCAFLLSSYSIISLQERMLLFSSYSVNTVLFKPFIFLQRQRIPNLLSLLMHSLNIRVFYGTKTQSTTQSTA